MPARSRTLLEEEHAAAGASAQICRSAMTVHDQVERIYRENRDDLYLYLLCFRLPRAQAEDLTQEVFVALYRTMSKGDAIQVLRPWLFRVARNLALKARARSSAFLAIDPEAKYAVDTSAVNPEAELIERERMIRISDAVSTLSPQQKECLHLRARGLRYHEIAFTIGISSSAVGEFLRRGLKKLREALDA